MAYGRSYIPDGTPVDSYWPPAFTEGMSEAELSVMAPPYAVRLDRSVLNTDGSSEGKDSDGSDVKVTVESRSAAKKQFDKDVFKTDYF